jgi:hypothetical protein
LVDTDVSSSNGVLSSNDEGRDLVGDFMTFASVAALYVGGLFGIIFLIHILDRITGGRGI